MFIQLSCVMLFLMYCLVNLTLYKIYANNSILNISNYFINFFYYSLNSMIYNLKIYNRNGQLSIQMKLHRMKRYRNTKIIPVIMKLSFLMTIVLLKQMKMLLKRSFPRMERLSGI